MEPRPCPDLEEEAQKAIMSNKIRETIEATCDQLTEGEKLKLIERLARSLRVAPPVRSPDQRRAALNQLRNDLAALPVGNPADGLTGRDHDKLC
jgi:hypothetical protein